MAASHLGGTFPGGFGAFSSLATGPSLPWRLHNRACPLLKLARCSLWGKRKSLDLSARNLSDRTRGTGPPRRDLSGLRWHSFFSCHGSAAPLAPAQSRLPQVETGPTLNCGKNTKISGSERPHNLSDRTRGTGPPRRDLRGWFRHLFFSCDGSVAPLAPSQSRLRQVETGPTLNYGKNTKISGI